MEQDGTNPSSAGNDLEVAETQKLIEAVLGGSIDAQLAARISEWSQTSNAEKVAERANDKVDGNPQTSVPPRLAVSVFEKSLWADNGMLVEYLSGILASARSSEVPNDRGIAWTSLVGRLSSDQLALHWVLYTAVQERSRESDYATVWDLVNEQTVVELDLLLDVLDLRDTALNRIYRVLEAAYGLEREGLLQKLSHGQGKYLSDEVVYTRGFKYEPDTLYLTFAVTSHGIGLLLQALGLISYWLDAFVDNEFVSNRIDSVTQLPRLGAATFVQDFEPLSVSSTSDGTPDPK